jgi:hypothetical protein
MTLKPGQVWRHAGSGWTWVALGRKEGFYQWSALTLVAPTGYEDRTPSGGLQEIDEAWIRHDSYERVA